MRSAAPIERLYEWIARHARRVGNSSLQALGDPRAWPRGLRVPDWMARRKDCVAAEDWPFRSTGERLRSLASAEFAEAKFWYLVVTWLYVLAALLVIVDFFVFYGDKLSDDNAWHRVLLVAAAALSFLALLTRYRGVERHVTAQEADWRSLLLDAFGDDETEARQSVAIEMRISDSARRRTKDNRGYYKSEAPLGNERLRQNLQETAFFTGLLYAAAARRATRFACLAFVPVAAVGVLTLLPAGQEWERLLPVVIGAFLPTADVIGRIRSWRAAAASLGQTVERLDPVPPERTLFALFADMIVATGLTSPIPQRVYDTGRADVDQAWDARCKRAQPALRVASD